MLICELDGKELKSRKMLHDALADTLHFPEWYGRNLDALYDCLTDAQEELEIRFLNKGELEEHVGGYADCLVKVIRMAAEDNPGIRCKIEES